MLEFVSLLYVYKLVVSDKVKHHRINELKELFFKRMPKKSGFFKNNELIKSNYAFACKVISAFFRITNTTICQYFFRNYVDKLTRHTYDEFRIIKTVVFVRTALRRRSIFLPKITVFQK